MIIIISRVTVFVCCLCFHFIQIRIGEFPMYTNYVQNNGPATGGWDLFESHPGSNRERDAGNFSSEDHFVNLENLAQTLLSRGHAFLGLLACKRSEFRCQGSYRMHLIRTDLLLIGLEGGPPGRLLPDGPEWTGELSQLTARG